MKDKSEIISAFASSSNDTGSASVQVALLTERIKIITAHLQVFKKDFSARRGLLILVGKRTRLLRYIQKNTPKIYLDVISKLGLKDKISA